MPLALSGGINVWGEFPGESRNQFIDGLTTFLLQAGWQLAVRVKATISGVHSHNPNNGDTVQAGGLTYTFVTTLNNSVPLQVKIGGTMIISLQNLVSAINHNLPDAGTLWSTVTPVNPQVTASFNGVDTVTLTSLFGGPVGNGTPSTYGALVNGGYKVHATSPQGNLTGGGGGATVGEIQSRSYIYDHQATDAFSNVYSHVKMSSIDETIASNEQTLRTIAPIVITNATNATPVVITTATNHGYSTGANVNVQNVIGNVGANGTWNNVTVLDATHISLTGSAGTGAYISGGLLRSVTHVADGSTIFGRRFRVVANRCQFFCYVPGIAGDNFGSLMCGGCPWMPPTSACSGEVAAPSTTLGFWISSDRAPLTNPATSPRTSCVLNQHYTQDLALTGNTFTKNDASGWTQSDAAFNTQVTLGGNTIGTFRLMAMTPFPNFPLNVGTAMIDSIKWFGAGDVGKPMLLEPLVAWGPVDSTHPPEVRGQLWDAWVRTDQVPMDTVQTFSDSRIYVAMTDVAKFGTLWLIVPSLTPTQIESIQASYAN